jgi:hypothetical protein
MPIKRTKMLLRIHYNPRGRNSLCALRTICCRPTCSGDTDVTLAAQILPPELISYVCSKVVVFSDMNLSTLYTDEMTIRTRLGREGAQILQNPTTDASSGTAAETSVDFEIEPDVYRSVEAMVKSLAAGTPPVRLLEVCDDSVGCKYDHRCALYAPQVQTTLHAVTLYLWLLTDGVRMEVLHMRSANTTTATTGTTGTVGPTTAPGTSAPSGPAVKNAAGVVDEAVDSGGLANLSLSDGDGADGAGMGAVCWEWRISCLVLLFSSTQGSTALLDSFSSCCFCGGRESLVVCNA